MGKHIYNRYEAQQHHKSELKRRHTPYRFANYDSYCDYKSIQAWDWNLHGEYYNMYAACRAHGEKPWYEKYWSAYSGYLAEGWKTNLKAAAARDRRTKYKRELYKYLTTLDYDDCEGDFSPNMRSNKGFDDPWNWD